MNCYRQSVLKVYFCLCCEHEKMVTFQGLKLRVYRRKSRHRRLRDAFRQVVPTEGRVGRARTSLFCIVAPPRVPDRRRLSLIQFSRCHPSSKQGVFASVHTPWRGLNVAKRGETTVAQVGEQKRGERG